MGVDFGKTASDYARHRAGFPEAFFDRLIRDGVARETDRVLDLGTGTGNVARGFARRGCDVVGLDPSQALLEQAERLDKEAGLTIRHVQATAEQTGLSPESFDLVAAGQCWHWFDRPKAAAEAGRVLVRGGRIMIAHLDWLSLPGNVVEASETLIGEHNPTFEWAANGVGTAGVYPNWFGDLTSAGFESIESFTFDVRVPYSHEAWLGRIRASAPVGASLPPDRVAAFDADHRHILQERFPDEPLQIPHRVFAVWGRKPYTRVAIEQLGSP
jgi:SAM-dependent methyltransferase